MKTMGRLVGFILIGLISSFVYSETIRVGYFLNITHAQAVIGIANGTFQKALGPNTKIETKLFNSGPGAVEALVVNSVDMVYLGPNPAINGYVRSDGTALKIIAGAASGGASLIVRQEAGIQKITDFHNRQIASPQIGNTQDVSLRYWLTTNGFRLKQSGGDVQVITVSNADQVSLFINKKLDAAWAVEPWASRLIHDGNGKLFLDERTLWNDGKFNTALIAINPNYLRDHQALVKKWLSAHVDMTQWIRENPELAQKAFNGELKKLTRKTLNEEVLKEAFQRFEITYDPLTSTLYENAKRSYIVGYLGTQKPDLSGIYDLSLLQEVIIEKKLEPIH